MRAEVAVIALRDGLRTRDLDERREWFLLARFELLKSLRRIEADLDKLPLSQGWGPGTWRQKEARFLDWCREQRRKRLKPVV